MLASSTASQAVEQPPSSAQTDIAEKPPLETSRMQQPNNKPYERVMKHSLSPLPKELKNAIDTRVAIKFATTVTPFPQQIMPTPGHVQPASLLPHSGRKIEPSWQAALHPLPLLQLQADFASVDQVFVASCSRQPIILSSISSDLEASTISGGRPADSRVTTPSRILVPVDTLVCYMPGIIANPSHVWPANMPIPALHAASDIVYLKPLPLRDKHDTAESKDTANKTSTCAIERELYHIKQIPHDDGEADCQHKLKLRSFTPKWPVTAVISLHWQPSYEQFNLKASKLTLQYLAVLSMYSLMAWSINLANRPPEANTPGLDYPFHPGGSFCTSFK